MSIRLWHQSMAPLDEFGAFADMVREHLKAVVPADVIVDMHGSYPGSYLGGTPAEVLRYPLVKHLIQEQIFDHCLTAEKEGYDAIALASFSEPFLTEVRSLVDIPVASMPESCLLVGCSYAAKLALVTLTPKSIPRVRALVNQHGLIGRVSGIFALDPPITERILIEILNGEADPGPVLSSFTACARQAAAAGADLVIPAEGALNEVLWSHKLSVVDGVEVLDGLSVVMTYAHMMIRLKRVAGLSAARAISHPMAPPDLLARAMRRARSGYPATGGGDIRT